MREPLLPGRVMALLFEKPSLRTRVSFEAGMTHLGGSSMILGDDVGFGKRESIADFARVLSEIVDVIVVRAKNHQTVVEVAALHQCAVINGLTDLAHPCQALADLYTLNEHFGELEGPEAGLGRRRQQRRPQLGRGCGKLGMEFAMATPKGYQFDDELFAEPARNVPGAKFSARRPRCEGRRERRRAVYTDVWASMGQEAEQNQRKADFAAYQVNGELMRAAPERRGLHALPARPPRRRSDRRSDGRPSKHRRPASRQPHARAERHSGLAAGRERELGFFWGRGSTRIEAD